MPSPVPGTEENESLRESLFDHKFERQNVQMIEKNEEEEYFRNEVQKISSEAKT